MERVTIEGDSPLAENENRLSGILSSTVHVKSGVNPCRPRHKAKYSMKTDSELVPRGKGEKNRCERSEIVPEIMCLQGVRARKGDGVPFA